MAVCTKAYYLDQAAARLALAAIHEKARKQGRTGKLPVRVYPCDLCDGWHLTAKPVTGKPPPWDVDPNWVRPGPTEHLQRRSRDAVTPSRRRRSPSPRSTG